MGKALAKKKQVTKVVKSVYKNDYKSDNPKKQQFVALYDQLYGHITNVCEATGISRETYYAWMKKDKCEWHLNDEIRDVLINKAGSGDMTAVIFYLKNRHPDFKQGPSLLIQQNFSEHMQAEEQEYI